MAMALRTYTPFFGDWTSMNPSYFDANRRGTGRHDPAPYVCMFKSLVSKEDEKIGLCLETVWMRRIWLKHMERVWLKHMVPI